MKDARPIVGTIIGDPNGIGPEVSVKAWAAGKAHAVSRPLMIGNELAVRRAVEITGLKLKLRRVSSPHDLSDSPEIIDLLDTVDIDPDEIRPGHTSTACGAACGEWLRLTDQLIDGGEIAASVIAPIEVAAMKAAGVIDMLVPPLLGKTYLLLISGKLRVAHLTDHIPLREVCRLITPELVDKALVELDRSLRSWGIAQPRIAVAGLNPHAAGEEEDRAITPGVNLALQRGIDARGPVSPDTVFRHCVEERYDAVLAIYHDQGHIAIKTWGFTGNSLVVLGAPRLLVSVAHGTAHDIVGRGIADPSMMESAMVTAGFFAAGRGFPQ